MYDCKHVPLSRVCVSHTLARPLTLFVTTGLCCFNLTLLPWCVFITAAAATAESEPLCLMLLLVRRLRNVVMTLSKRPRLNANDVEGQHFLVTVVNEFLRLDPKMEVGLFYCRFYDVFPNIKSK